VLFHFGLIHPPSHKAAPTEDGFHEWKLMLDDKYAMECACEGLRPDQDYEFFVQVWFFCASSIKTPKQTNKQKTKKKNQTRKTRKSHLSHTLIKSYGVTGDGPTSPIVTCRTNPSHPAEPPANLRLVVASLDEVGFQFFLACKEKKSQQNL
jgi:hypothetical protein